MPTTDTPLRYPGGKSQLTPLVVEILGHNEMFYGEYAEPFAGGAGIAMALLLNDYVSKVYLNDIDPAIFAFWHSVVHDHEALCERIASVNLDMTQWRRQREVFLDKACGSLLDKGFATLFLNRTNRSGILRGGVIGGQAQQGNYKLDCRFNRVDLVRKIRRISQYREQIELSCLDASKFVNTVVPKMSDRALVNLDPPYFGMGPELYTNFYKPADHTLLAEAVSKMKRRWMVTYDDTPEIRQLYMGFPTFSSALNYSAQVKRVGVELLITDPALRLPPQFERLRLEPALAA